MQRLIVNIKIFTAILFALTLFVSCKADKKEDTAFADETSKIEKPNIIYIMADDLSRQAISAYGGIYKDIAPTPNIDRLAKEGMLFTDVLCTNAICGPSRAAILTGKYSETNGYYKNENGGKFNSDQWTFPQEFQTNGYATSLFGKWHLGSEPVGFDEYKYHNSAGQQGHYWNPVYNVNGKDSTYTGYSTNLTTEFALEWLQKETSANKPFMMVLQYKAPHRPWEPDTKYENLWDDIEMPYPSTFDDDYKGRELTAGDTEMTMDFLSRRDMKMPTPKGLKGRDKIAWDFYGAKRGELVQPDGMTYEEGKKWRYQNYIKDYLACVKSVDDNIGRVLNYLDENGLAENTVIVLTSDQGFYLGDHGFFDKRFIYEESLVMPFIMKYPKKIKAGSLNSDIITNIDFAPTLLDLAGIKSNEKLQGKSFKSNIEGKTSNTWRDAMFYHYYEFPYWHHIQPHYGIRTQKYTLAHFYYNIDVWELYDLEKDPNQLNNIINDPQYATVVSELKAKLNDLKEEFEPGKTLDDFRKVTDEDFGSIIDKEDDETSVQDVLTGN